MAESPGPTNGRPKGRTTCEELLAIRSLRKLADAREKAYKEKQKQYRLQLAQNKRCARHLEKEKILRAVDQEQQVKQHNRLLQKLQNDGVISAEVAAGWYHDVSDPDCARKLEKAKAEMKVVLDYHGRTEAMVLAENFDIKPLRGQGMVDGKKFTTEDLQMAMTENQKMAFGDIKRNIAIAVNPLKETGPNGNVDVNRPGSSRDGLSHGQVTSNSTGQTPTPSDSMLLKNPKHTTTPKTNDVSGGPDQKRQRLG